METIVHDSHGKSGLWETRHLKAAAALLACGHPLVGHRKETNRKGTVVYFQFADDEARKQDYISYTSNTLNVMAASLFESYERLKDIALG